MCKSITGISFFIRAQGSKFGENGTRESKLGQENRDKWVPDIPCYDPAGGGRPRRPNDEFVLERIGFNLSE